MFGNVVFIIIALVHGHTAALPQKAADAATRAARAAPTAPAPPPPVVTPKQPTPPAAPVAPAAPTSPAADKVVASVQGYYNTTSKLEAHFRQRYTNSVI